MDELARLEKEKNIRPVPEVDAFMKVSIYCFFKICQYFKKYTLIPNISNYNIIAQASSVGGRTHSVSTDYVLKVLGLDVCADTVVGSEMLRGVSGGQKKRVTTGLFLFMYPFMKLHTNRCLFYAALILLHFLETSLLYNIF